MTLQGSSAYVTQNFSINRVFINVLCFMKLQLVFSTANFVYKLKKSENFKKRRYNANGNANI